jgi:hypothetical protein
MIQNPTDTPIPEGIYATVTIHARLVNPTTWEIFCPEWRCTMHATNLTARIAQLTAEIEAHNEQEKTGIPSWYSPDFDFNSWAEERGVTRLRKEQWPLPPKSLRNTTTNPIE